MAHSTSRRIAVSHRTSTILNMVTRDSSTITNTETVCGNRNQNRAEYSIEKTVNNLYGRPYSMTSNIFDTFCETQISYNTQHSSSLNDIVSTFKEAISGHQQTITKQVETFPLVANSPNQKTGYSDLMCHEIMPSENDNTVPNASNPCTPQSNLQCDFDSDDSVRDKDYHPSDSSDDSNDDIQVVKPSIHKSRALPTTTLQIKNPHKSSSKTIQATVMKNIPKTVIPNKEKQTENWLQKRRISIDETQKTLYVSPSLCRKRRHTIEVGEYQSFSTDNGRAANTMESEITQPLKKRKKYNTSLLQRKMDAKNEKRLKYNVKTGCDDNCIKKCSTKLSQEEREAINKRYWDMTWSEQHSFVESYTSIAVPKRRVTTEPKRKPKRTFSFKKLDGTKIEVCKIFFFTTLGYKKTNDRILHNTFTDLTTDRRGKHQKTPAFDRDLMTQHVESYNPCEPHYRREHAPLRRYLPSDVTITDMHKDFCNKYPDKPISYELYRQHVKKMNISFTRLGNEECELCEVYRLHQIATSHDAKKEIVDECVLCVDWDIHHKRYNKARRLYGQHKSVPNNSSEIYVSADLEKVIMLPRLETFKSVIFCPRLVAYNQTFAPIGKISPDTKPLNVIWHDAVSGRKQEDIMSAFYYFLLRNRDISDVHIWLDNCSAQNKNWLLYSLLVHLVNSEIICTERITLYYFEPGHTYMSCDQVHHQVELAMKKKRKLYDFVDFEEAVSSINNSKVNVKSMSPENFLIVPNYVSDRRVQNSSPRAYLKNMSQVCFTRTTYDMLYKNDFDDNYILLRFLNDKYLKNPEIMKLEFQSKPKGIDTKRKTDLIRTISSIVPPHKLLFWKNLPTNVNGNASTSGTRNKKVYKLHNVS